MGVWKLTFFISENKKTSDEDQLQQATPGTPPKNTKRQEVKVNCSWLTINIDYYLFWMALFPVSLVLPTNRSLISPTHSLIFILCLGLLLQTQSPLVPKLRNSLKSIPSNRSKFFASCTYQVQFQAWVKTGSPGSHCLCKVCVQLYIAVFEWEMVVVVSTSISYQENMNSRIHTQHFDPIYCHPHQGKTH